jgi:hypothetical protein
MKQLYEPVKDKQRHIVADTTQDPKVNAEQIRTFTFLGKEQKK